MAETLEQKKIRIARRLSETEKIPFSEAAKLIPDSPEELRKLVDRLNGLHGGDRSPDGQKIGRARRRAEKTGESFNQAARFTR